MPHSSYALDPSTLMSEDELAAWLRVYPPAANAAARAQVKLEDQLLKVGGPAAVTAYHDCGELEVDHDEAMEDRLLLLVGTACLRAGQEGVWSEIWRLVHIGDDVLDDEFAFLEDATRRARAGKL